MKPVPTQPCYNHIHVHEVQLLRLTPTSVEMIAGTLINGVNLFAGERTYPACNIGHARPFELEVNISIRHHQRWLEYLYFVIGEEPNNPTKIEASSSCSLASMMK